VAVVESTTKVVLGGVRGGPELPTLRQDRWWIQPVATMSILVAFVIYSTWAAFQNKYYFVGADVHATSSVPFTHPASPAVASRGQKRASPGTTGISRRRC